MVHHGKESSGRFQDFYFTLVPVHINTKNLLTGIFSTWLTKYELQMVWTHFFFFFLMYFSWANSVLSLNVVLLSMSCWTISLNTHEWTCELNVFGTTYEHLKTFMNNSTNCSACCRVLLLFILYDVFPFNTLNIYFTFDMHAFSRSFYPKLIQAIHFFCFYQYVCSLGIEPTTFCTANTMLYHWATGTHHLFFIGT